MALDNFRTIELIWDKANKSIIKTIKTASSDTTGRYLTVKVLDGGQEVTLSNAKLQLYWEHPNFNTSGTDDFNTVNNGGLFRMTFSEEMLTNIGELNAHLVLIMPDGKITSDGFPIEVLKGANDGVVVPTNGKGLVKQIDAKIDKGNVTLNDLTQEVKLAMTGGSVAVVGEGAVGTVNIQPKAVTPKETSFATTVLGTANIFDKTNIINGYNIDTNQLGLYVKEGWFTSNLIPAKANTVYTGNVNERFAEYDVNGVQIRALIGKTITTSATTGYIQVSGSLTNLESLMVVEGTTLPVTYQPYSPKTQINNLAIEPEQVQHLFFEDGKLRDGLVITKKNTSYIYRDSSNEFDKTAVFPEMRFRTDSSTYYRADYSVSDFIKVEPNSPYSITADVEVIQYDKNKNYLSGVKLTTDNLTFETLPNASYVRFSIYQPHLETFVFAKGSVLPSYQDFHIYRFDDTIKVNGEVEEVKKFDGGVWNVLGDSITNRPQYSYWTILAPKLGIANVNNFGVSGTTIAVRSGRTDSFVERFPSMPAADLITVFGHTNDFGTNVPLGEFSDRVNTTFYGACHELISGLVAKYPVNKIAVFTTIPRYNMQEKNSLGYYVHDYADALMEVCGFYGVSSFDILRNSQIKAYNETAKTAYIPDGLHPNEAGYDLLAEQMLPLLEGI